MTLKLDLSSIAMQCMAIGALHGITLSGIGTAKVGDVGPVYSDGWASEELAVAALSVTVPFTLVDGGYMQEFDEFLRLGVTWQGKEALPGPEVDDVRDDA